jgi:hypothetical protein
MEELDHYLSRHPLSPILTADLLREVSKMPNDLLIEAVKEKAVIEPYMEAFYMDNEAFGRWCVDKVRSIDCRFQPRSNSKHDLRLEGRRIEVKGSRATDTSSKLLMPSKALSSNDNKPFTINMHQVRMGKAEALVLLGVWKNALRYWVFLESDLKCLGLNFQTRGRMDDNPELQIIIPNHHLDRWNRWEVKQDKVVDIILGAPRERLPNIDVLFPEITFY